MTLLCLLLIAGDDMAIPQRKFREIVFQIFYSQDIGGRSSGEDYPVILDQLTTSKKIIMQAHEKAEAALEHKVMIDDWIQESSNDYEFDRISSVELNTLRLGIYEMLFCDDIPPKVAISEAIRLCRKFGSKEGSNFVNAILDKIYFSKSEKQQIS